MNSDKGTKSIKDSRTLTVLFGILVVIVVIAVFYLLRSIIKPFLVAVFLSILFEPVMTGLRKIRVPKALAVIIVLLLAFTSISLLGLLVYAGASSFDEQFPVYQAKIVKMFNDVLGVFQIPIEDLRNYISQIDWAAAIQDLSLPAFVSRSVGSILSFLGNVFLVLIFMVYALLGKEYLFFRIGKAFEGARSDRISVAINNINDQIQRYLVAKTIISLATGVMATVILLLFNVDLAIVFGLITFLLNFVPNVGSIIATLPPILLSLLQFDSLLKPLWIAIFLIASQAIMGNVVEPRVMGKSLDLSPLIVILSLLFWGFLWGIIGMVLAVPIAAAIKIITANIDNLRPISVLMSGAKDSDQ